MKHLLLGFALLGYAWTAAADDVELFKVELIVFENLDPDAIQAELWPPHPGTPPLDNAVELATITAAPPPAPAPAAVTETATPVAPAAAAPATAPPAPAPTPPPAWRWLDDAELGLNSQARRLDASQHYKTIIHVGWIQPVDNTDQGKSVHIYDGMEATRISAVPIQTGATVIPLAQDGGAAANPTSAADPAPAPPAAAPNTGDTAQAALDIGQSVPAGPAGPPPAATPHILDGTFTLRRSRFLHVDVDLGYTKTVSIPLPVAPADGTAPTDSATPATPQTTRYYVRMVQSRRIRNDKNKLNYLDHPLFGVLFQVTPYQAPAADDAAKQ